jgi:hypothetical protein
VWYDYTAFAAEHSVSVEVAIQLLTEATFILSELTNGELHGRREWLETYRVAGKYLDVAHAPIESVSSLARAHTCSDTPEEVSYCILSDRTIDLKRNPTGSRFLEEDLFYRGYGPACNCDKSLYTVTYVQASNLPPGSDRAVKKLADEYLKAMNGAPCALPERITTITRQGMSWTLLDPQDFLDKGLTGMASVDHWLSAVRRRTNGLRMRDPLHGVLLTSTLVDVASIDPEFDRIQGDVWTWDWETTADISDWSDLVVVMRDGPTTAANIIMTTADNSFITTDTDFATGLVWWQTAIDTADVAPGVYWIEASATVPSEGGSYTFMPARRMIVRAQVATEELGS